MATLLGFDKEQRVHYWCCERRDGKLGRLLSVIEGPTTRASGPVQSRLGGERVPSDFAAQHSMQYFRIRWVSEGADNYEWASEQRDERIWSPIGLRRSDALQFGQNAALRCHTENANAVVIEWGGEAAHAWAELHKKLVRLRPHQFFKISKVTARRLQFSQAMYCVKYLKASPEFKS